MRGRMKRAKWNCSGSFYWDGHSAARPAFGSPNPIHPYLMLITRTVGCVKAENVDPFQDQILHPFESVTGRTCSGDDFGMAFTLPGVQRHSHVSRN